MISVILPYFNAEATLKTAIESLINQTYENFELILCNDGSTDETLQMLQHFKTRSELHFQWTTIPNSGPGNA